MLADGYSTVWYALPQHLWGQMPCWTRLSHFSSPMAARGSGDIAGFSPTLEMGEVASAEVVLCAEERFGENVDTAVVSADYDSTLKASARQAPWISSSRCSVEQHFAPQPARAFCRLC